MALEISTVTDLRAQMGCLKAQRSRKIWNTLYTNDEASVGKCHVIQVIGGSRGGVMSLATSCVSVQLMVPAYSSTRINGFVGGLMMLLAFLMLCSRGVGDFAALQEWTYVVHSTKYRDSRFATHTRWRHIVIKILMCRKINTRFSYPVRRHICIESLGGRGERVRYWQCWGVSEWVTKWNGQGHVIVRLLQIWSGIFAVLIWLLAGHCEGTDRWLGSWILNNLYWWWNLLMIPEGWNPMPNQSQNHF